MTTSKPRGTTKSLGRKSALDKLYTKPAVAWSCIDFVGLAGYDLVIEPSAGSGTFSSQMPGCLALDLEPADPSVREQDWFTYQETRQADRRTLVIGNPPFGQQNSLAVRFINHAATFADTIAFILPRSFRKPSVVARLNGHLHLRAEMDLAADSFTLEGVDYAVPAIFQIWDWRPELRIFPPRRLTSPHFHFVAKEAQPDLRIARVGGRAGWASTDLNVAAASNYFLCLDDPDISIPEFVALVNTLSFPGREFGVGPRTICKDELIRVIEAGLNGRVHN